MIYIITEQQNSPETKGEFLTQIYNGYSIISFESFYQKISELKKVGIEFHYFGNTLACISFGNFFDQYIVDTTTINPETLSNIFENKNVLKICFNSKSKIKKLFEYNIKSVNFFDVIETEKLINNGFSEDIIKEICNELNIDIKKGFDAEILFYKYFKLKYSSYKNKIDFTNAKRNIIENIAIINKYLIDLQFEQEKIAKERNFYYAIYIENNFWEALAYIEYNGMYVNKDKIKEIYKKSLLNYNDLCNKYNEFVLNNQIHELITGNVDLFNDLIISRNIDLISKIKKREFIAPLLEKLVKIQEEEKTLDSYNKIYSNFLKSNNNRIKSTFFSTKNGRIASKEENIQGFPKNKFREIFVPQNNNVLISSDYVANELTILANYTKDNTLINLIKETDDPFERIAEKLNLENRDIAKTVHYIIQDGGTSTAIQKSLKITEEEAIKIYNNYAIIFEKTLSYFKKLNFFSFLTLTIKMSEYSNRIYNIEKDITEEYISLKKKENERKITNQENNLLFKIEEKIKKRSQSYILVCSASEILKIALVLLYRYIIANDLFGKVLIVNTIHDQILVECPKEIQEEIASKIKEIMISASSKHCKEFKMDVKQTINEF